MDEVQRIIQLDGKETAQFVFTNSAKPSLFLKKLSADGTPLAGVSFRLAKIEDGTFYLDRTEYHVELFPGKTSEKAIQNDRRPNLIVYKHNADTGEPIPDTVFQVQAADGHSVDEIREEE